MAVRHQLIERAPTALWTVLKDPSRFADWVVGTSNSAPREGRWPELGSSLTYTVKLGRKKAEGFTVVRRYEPPRYLELEAHAGEESARIAFDILPWGDDTLVIVDEHPLRGLSGSLHNTVLDALIQIRHRKMLSRLAQLVEEEAAASRPANAGQRGDAPPPSAVTGNPQSRKR
ncbi:SRPBCC family protein [Streptomyces sp. NBC_00820]|uniref:SRPBCC family protein n=1 Tax=Streptomyces sp. NBC_00820 TaxID=2975842 RepID=UPI002ED48B6A|nr:SRPBCC family protein [Streptomyces sp. NBC_00820]